MRLASVVLPVVRVFALDTLVASNLVVEGAPDSLEVEHIEVVILLHAMEEVN